MLCNINMRNFVLNNGWEIKKSPYRNVIDIFYLRLLYKLK